MQHMNPMNILRILQFSIVLVLATLTTVKCATRNSYAELKSNINLLCNNKKVERWKCPFGKESERRRMEFCFYQCPDGTKYICREDTVHGLIEFCANEETCEKGTMNKVYFDDVHQQVITEKVTCPDGFFEPWTGNCFLNCQHKHQNLDYVPKTIVVFFRGNSTHSALGYCDVDNGYVNWDHYMYINISLEDYAHFCYKDDNYKSKCAAGQRLLPDSTCAPSCADGYVPDKEKYFICVPYIGNSTTHSSFHPTAEVQKTNTSSISVISSTVPAKTVSTTVAQQSTGDFHNRDVTTGFIIFGVIIVVVILGAIALFVYVHKKRQNEPRVIIADTYNHKSKIINVLQNAENGTVNMKGGTYDVDHPSVTRTSSGDTDLSLHGSEFDQSPDEVSTVDGSPESGYLGEQNGQQLEVVADVQVDKSKNRQRVAVENVDETDCKEFLLPQNGSRKRQLGAEEDAEETECKELLLPQNRPVNVVQPLERPDDGVRMNLLKDTRE